MYRPVIDKGEQTGIIITDNIIFGADRSSALKGNEVLLRMKGDFLFFRGSGISPAPAEKPRYPGLQRRWANRKWLGAKHPASAQA